MNKTTLHWSYLNFKDVPMDLYLYEDLEEVYLKENFITTIPKWLLNVTTLKFIHLAGNNLSAIPEEMYLLENLEFLDVSNNQIRELPKTIGLMDRLQRLNVSGNELTELPAEIGALKQLEELNISKNHLQRLPIQLSECQRLNVLNLSDNVNIWHIPERISNLPSLQSLSADRCALFYLPVALSKFVNHVRIFHNTSITHVPMIYEKPFQTFYDNRAKVTPPAVTHDSFFWVLEKETNTRLLLPFGTRRIFCVPSLDNQVTLYDDCLKAVQYLSRYMPLWENVALKQMLPEKFIYNHIVNGPTARCTVLNCSNPLYTTYYFMAVKRRGSSSKQIFTCYFCSNHCANLWLLANGKKYYQLDWEVCED
ncbi:leucine-rich repeat protein SHOC-2 [Bactrocera tryoni]|uniref:leucine-rich repeat protein SHOC-2 n=1 Tax=Bactrocera tryoni TaxID=59916 RepID=UPI001A95656A|nr:leucine-rich repeat protein SHOC-2 [Bactrocera tryoni]XP_039957846.1 leucine-rich repeat protein SHOC-2 [Bactrocera tryoni]XP_039957847.1 leucine-rich repeat protein SHOC-2 [Bactrocera tryoni]XP_039957848.1 leucine-rich repeat protein SHOC-2 [Bactrocera tryoni]XP_039957849.1 leucine-rich repeat protein SHOC-2 [Bactrocera tryoni]XP_039957850.1 leucine-rich repeat protein SHOC-2 [Bactrocera tryoni]